MKLVNLVTQLHEYLQGAINSPDEPWSGAGEQSGNYEDVHILYCYSIRRRSEELRFASLW